MTLDLNNTQKYIFKTWLYKRLFNIYLHLSPGMDVAYLFSGKYVGDKKLRRRNLK